MKSCMRYLKAAYIGFTTGVSVNFAALFAFSYHLRDNYLNGCLSSLPEYFEGELNASLVQALCIGLLGVGIALLISFWMQAVKEHFSATKKAIGSIACLLPIAPFVYMMVTYVHPFW